MPSLDVVQAPNRKTYYKKILFICKYLLISQLICWEIVEKLIAIISQGDKFA